MWTFNQIENLQKSKVYEVELRCHDILPDNANARHSTRYKCMNPFFTVEHGPDSIPVETGSKDCYKEQHKAAVESTLHTHLTHKIHSWPRKTNVLCLHDCHPFEGIPCPLPESYNEKKGEWIISGDGVCCSPNCVKGYYEEHYDYQTPQKLMTLDNFVCQQLGITDRVKSAPPRSRLKAFNNNETHGLSIQEFRKYHLNVEKISRLPLSMIVHSMVFAEEYIDRHTPRDSNLSTVGFIANIPTPNIITDHTPIGNHSLPSMFNAFLVDKSKNTSMATSNILEASKINTTIVAKKRKVESTNTTSVKQPRINNNNDSLLNMLSVWQSPETKQ